jgi:hypothetical protein
MAMASAFEVPHQHGDFDFAGRKKRKEWERMSKRPHMARRTTVYLRSVARRLEGGSGSDVGKGGSDDPLGSVG